MAALYQRPPARACGSWPPNRLARKTANLTAGRQDPVARDDQRHQIPGHGLTGVTASSWVKNPGFPMEIRAPGTAVKIARSSVEVFSQGLSVPDTILFNQASVLHLSRKHRLATAPAIALSGLAADRDCRVFFCMTSSGEPSSSPARSRGTTVFSTAEPRDALLHHKYEKPGYVRKRSWTLEATS